MYIPTLDSKTVGEVIAEFRKKRAYLRRSSVGLPISGGLTSAPLSAASASLPSKRCTVSQTPSA